MFWNRILFLFQTRFLLSLCGGLEVEIQHLGTLVMVTDGNSLGAGPHQNHFSGRSNFGEEEVLISGDEANRNSGDRHHIYQWRTSRGLYPSCLCLLLLTS